MRGDWMGLIVASDDPKGIFMGIIGALFSDAYPLSFFKGSL